MLSNDEAKSVDGKVPSACAVCEDTSRACNAESCKERKDSDDIGTFVPI